MLNIEFDLGHAPSVLAALRNPANAQHIANAAAERFVDDVHDWIAAGHGFTPRNGGGLEQAINWRPLSGGAAEVSVNKDYAGYVEHGTGVHVGHRPWVIRPRDGRGGLRIPVSGGGGYVIRRQVTHQGSKPHPYFFADMETRKQHLQAAGLSVLAGIIARGQ